MGFFDALVDPNNWKAVLGKAGQGLGAANDFINPVPEPMKIVIPGGMVDKTAPGYTAILPPKGETPPDMWNTYYGTRNQPTLGIGESFSPETSANIAYVPPVTTRERQPDQDFTIKMPEDSRMRYMPFISALAGAMGGNSVGSSLSGMLGGYAHGVEQQNAARERAWQPFAMEEYKRRLGMAEAERKYGQTQAAIENLRSIMADPNSTPEERMWARSGIARLMSGSRLGSPSVSFTSQEYRDAEIRQKNAQAARDEAEARDVGRSRKVGENPYRGMLTGAETTVRKQWEAFDRKVEEQLVRAQGDITREYGERGKGISIDDYDSLVKGLMGKRGFSDVGIRKKKDAIRAQTIAPILKDMQEWDITHGVAVQPQGYGGPGSRPGGTPAPTNVRYNPEDLTWRDVNTNAITAPPPGYDNDTIAYDPTGGAITFNAAVPSVMPQGPATGPVDPTAPTMPPPMIQGRVAKPTDFQQMVFPPAHVLNASLRPRATGELEIDSSVLRNWYKNAYKVNDQFADAVVGRLLEIMRETYARTQEAAKNAQR